jgi:MraZ protein
MFRGEHYNSLDGKGRTSIPARLRTVFAETLADERFVITKCLPVNTGAGEVCRGLVIYPFAEFQSLEQKFEKGSGLSVAALNSIRRHVLAPAVECAADKQGRVLIPPTLRDYAGLEKEIIFVGMQRKIEIWDARTWDKVCVQAEKDIPDDNAALAELGI